MTCPFTGPKMFCAGPKFLSQSKNFTAFSASSKPSTCLKCPALPEMLKGAFEKLPEEMPNYDTFGGPESIALEHVSRNCL